MSVPQLTEEQRAEIIIVRRKRSGGDGHHGGAWKIAFADFMTAMMALFLVLWLVNAANEETRKAVASYFNPVKLVDRHRSERGLNTIDGPTKKKDEPKLNEPEQQGEQDGEKSSSAASAEESAEASFRENPQQVLNELARQAKADAQMALQQLGAIANELRDPFSNARLALGPVEEKPIIVRSKLEIPSESPKPDAVAEAAVAEREQSKEVQAPKIGDAVQQPKDEKSIEKESDTPNDASETAPETNASAEKLKAEIAQNKPQITETAIIDVRNTPEGTLISILETPSFPLFRSGSAIPEGNLVLLLEALGETLKSQQGDLEVRGHTDAVPYRSRSYDNWNLSTDRAHSTRLMLLRSGLESTRIGAVSGFAESRPIEGKDPVDPVNRRIEILLRTA